ncbi:ABC transporter ATP-binding protein [Sphingomonas sp. TZW2008]|uniref:ABC transporter ATP-binding protein n=1 Tax=Sphingomonas sp. TZW2008 TaxID=1917973 RepID=UPI000A2701F2|nr:ABC transporter ATP-binding protein [Sphingomonas sp. TZW2008]
MVTVTLDGVGVRLAGRQVVEDVSFTADGAAFVGVLGPNGAGKSSLIRALLGLLPASGRIAIDGQPVANIAAATRGRRLAYLPQGQALHWPISIARLVALGRLPHLAPFSRLGDDDRAAIARAMDVAEVTSLAHRVATELSGGERARVMLARALAVEAPVLIADEPLASLDPAHQLHGMEILQAQVRAGVLVIAVLHDLGFAARFCDRVLVMKAGRLVADGAPGAVLTPPLLADVYGISALFHDGQPIAPLARTGA